MSRRPQVCSIVPPHILRSIAENGDDEDRDRAHLALEASAQTRGERAVPPLRVRSLVPLKAMRRRFVYDAQNERELPGKRVRGEGERRTADAAATEAYDGAGKTYDFFQRVHGRNSIDDRGLRLDSTVHYAKNFNNAQWNGRQMIYGDGDGKYFNRFTVALDVIAHELTHGVTQHSAALGYSGQPGALSEHFSDVFGILVKQRALKLTASRSDWLIGAGLFTSRVNGAAIRSMKAPGSAFDDKILGRDPQPSHLRDYVKMDGDNGGVHVNCGIPNHAFYRAATLLGGRAWQVAGKIWYRALTEMLTSRSRFQDCADATWHAAVELYGAKAEPQEAVRMGWDAVGITVRQERKRETMEFAVGAAEIPVFA